MLIPNTPGVTGGITSYAQDMKNFMFVGGNNPWWASDPTFGTSVPAGGWITVFDGLITDTAIPNRPTISYMGTSGFPVDGLTFQSSPFADPQGNGTFAAMQWRIAEVLATNTPVSNVSQLRLEWDAAWTSPELSAFNSNNTFPEFAVQAGRRYRARVRHKDDTGRWSAWSLPAEFVPSPRDTISILRTNLVFNELMYNPPGSGATDGDEFEFVELKNIGTFTLNLSGLFIAQGIDFNFTNGTTLAPGALFLLARNPSVLASRYPGVVVHGVFTGKLNNDGETVAVEHPTAGEIVSITWTDRAPWPATADGFGFSLVRDSAGDYRASAERFGNPGADGGADGPGGIVINEFLSNSTLPLKDMIELLNTSSTNVDISGWYLTDDPKLPQKFRIPARAPLAPGAFATFTEDEFNPTPGMGVSFTLSSIGDELYLFSADAGAQLTGYDYGIGFGAAADGESFGRYVNSAGEELFPAQVSRTFGSTNAGPRTGPVIIHEVNYNPEPGSDEFIEIRNITASPVALFDATFPTNTWRVNGAGFSFPTNFTLGANELVLVVATNPAVFRARYIVPSGVTILGPFTGSLQDSGERLELQQPGIPGTNGVPFITVDEVRYNDKAPWPAAADGSGPSLQKRVAGSYGNEPTNWIAAAVSPGTDLPTGAAPTILSQPQSVNTVIGSNASFTVTYSGAAPLNFRWRHNGSYIRGATNATLVLTNVQLSQTGAYSIVIFNNAGSVLSEDAIQTVTSPVSFTRNPVNQFVQPGTNVTLVATAEGTGPIRYQWRFEGTDIPNATNATYSFTGANLSNHHGNFSVVAYDDISAAVSSNAFIYVMVRVGVVTQLQPMTVLQGGTVTFSVVATGAPPLWYRWIRGGAAFLTNQSPTLTLTNVQVGNTYRVGITNAATPSGVFSLPSGSVTLTVLPDVDQDGMADAWETNYFGSDNTTNTPANALLDPDGDRMINRDEYVAGTNPTDASSVLKIVMSATNGSQLEFVAQTNISYSVQWRTNLSSAAWGNLTNISGQSGVRTIQLNNVFLPAEGERYYRIVTPQAR